MLACSEAWAGMMPSVRPNPAVYSSSKPVALAGGGGGGGDAAIVQSSHVRVGSGNVGTVTLPSNTTAGNFLMVVSHGYETPGPCALTSFADNTSNSYVTVASSGLAGNNNFSEHIGYAANINGGATTVTITLGASCTADSMYVVEYSGLSTTAPIEASSALTGSGTDTGSGPITVADSKIVFGSMFSSVGNTTVTAGAGYVQRAEEEQGDLITVFNIQDQGSGANISPGVYASSATIGASTFYSHRIIGLR